MSAAGRIEFRRKKEPPTLLIECSQLLVRVIRFNTSTRFGCAVSRDGYGEGIDVVAPGLVTRCRVLNLPYDFIPITIKHKNGGTWLRFQSERGTVLI